MLYFPFSETTPPTPKKWPQPRAGGGCAALDSAVCQRIQKVYGEPAIDIGVTTAIAAFEDTLVTPDSRFDQWLKGNKKALSARSCAATKLSRTAVVWPVTMAQNVWRQFLPENGPGRAVQNQQPGRGRVAVTGKDADRFTFKGAHAAQCRTDLPVLPRWRNRRHRAGGGRDGRLQLGKKFTEQEIGDGELLKTLTGKQPDFKLPILPPSTDSTPRPRPFD